MIQAAALLGGVPAGSHRPRPGQVHLWDVRLEACDEPAAGLISALSDEERGRAARLIEPGARRRFVLAHLLLRELLASYVQIRPEALSFEQGAFGRPRLAGPALRGGIDFNMSHSGGTLLIAITAGDPVGVDVETRRSVRDALAIVRRHFAPAEHDRFAALPPERRDHAFLVGWTRKEAVMKAHGGGIGLGLDRVATGFEPAGDTGLEARIGDEAFRVRDLAGADYLGAIACRGPIDELVLRTLPRAQPPRGG